MIKKKTKKIIKWIVGIFIALLIFLIATPFLFKDKIVQLATKTVNNNLNATLSYEDSELSLLSNFPLVNLSLNNVALTNKAPFLGDTLYAAEKLEFSLKLSELFKKADEAINIENIATSNAKLKILVDEDGNANYDIAKETQSSETENTASFSFNINKYSLENVDFSYHDKTTNNIVLLEEINHVGNGNFAKDIFDLDTKTKALLTLIVDNTSYLSKVNVDLDALLAIDLKNNLYTFKKNEGHLNQLPLEFQGSLKLENDDQLYNLKFKTPTSSFKNGLALFPKEMTGNLADVKTEGNFNVNGIVKGVLSETTIPEFNIEILAKNAMFKYNNLPKAVENINADIRILNTTGKAEDTYITAENGSFKIDNNNFKASGKVEHLGKNPFISVKADGTVNLGDIHKVYPLEKGKDLAGILTANVSSSFTMDAIEKKKYQSVKNAGTLSVNNFKYDDVSVANPFFIDKTSIDFNTNTIKLKEFKAKTGTSDLSIAGNLENFYGFIFNDELLKGTFNLSANNLKVADFISKTETENTQQEKGKLQIPAFLDVTLNAKSTNVVYDNINLKNISGTLFVKNETVTLKNVNSNLFGGNVVFDGNVSSKEKTPSFAMDLKLNELNITESFTNLEMLKTIAPIAKTIEGKINSTITISGNLTDNYTPDLKSITGKLFGQLLNTKLKAGNSKTLSLLGDKVSFLDPNKLNLDKVTGYFSFENGVVTVKPIPLSYKDVNMTIGGTHGFDKSINYDINFDVPTKYLGSEITAALAKLTPKDASEIKSIPVKAIVNGSFTNPSISTNIKQATSNLMSQIIEKQKQSLTDKGKDKLKDLLGLKKNDSVKKDSTQKPKDLVKDKAKDVLKNLFGKRKKDTTKQN